MALLTRCWHKTSALSTYPFCSRTEIKAECVVSLPHVAFHFSKAATLFFTGRDWYIEKDYNVLKWGGGNYVLCYPSLFQLPAFLIQLDVQCYIQFTKPAAAPFICVENTFVMVYQCQCICHLGILSDLVVTWCIFHVCHEFLTHSLLRLM